MGVMQEWVVACAAVGVGSLTWSGSPEQTVLGAITSRAEVAERTTHGDHWGQTFQAPEQQAQGTWSGLSWMCPRDNRIARLEGAARGQCFGEGWGKGLAPEVL